MQPLEKAHLNKAEFSTDLSNHLLICEKNYYRLMQLLPGLREGSREWGFQVGEQSKIAVVVRLLTAAPYTSEVDVAQSRGGYELPKLRLRLCHDLNVAEVIAFGDHRNWKPKYDYPNTKMYQPNEKLVLNQFLSEWLCFCRKHGLALC